jgi:pyruvate formate lyase activating enzyme
MSVASVPSSGEEPRAAELWGYIHSEQTGSALDGPGLRTVLWLSGCELRCQYCHNPDTWDLYAGRRVRLEEAVAEVMKYARFMRSASGGVTVSGGEPLVQHAFCAALLGRLRDLGVHTALDTNGMLGDRLSDAELDSIDLVLLDLKSWEPHLHRSLTGHDPAPALRFARRLAARKRPAWVRFVLVPGVTDHPDNVRGLARFCAGLGNLERLEVLPFHQLGRYKWRALGIPYPLEDVQPPDAGAVEAARQIFRSEGVRSVG